MSNRQHGKYSTYNRGCRCEPCAAAMYKYKTRYFLRRTQGDLKVPALGAIRRIRALQAIGWTLDSISAAAGWSGKGNSMSVLRQETILASTHERVCLAYEKLSGTPGPSVRLRRRGEREGWAPPLAWDDIDSLSAMPVGADRRAVDRARAERADWVRRMTVSGLTDRQVAARFGVSRDTVVDIRRSAGIPTTWGAAA